MFKEKVEYNKTEVEKLVKRYDRAIKILNEAKSKILKMRSATKKDVGELYFWSDSLHEFMVLDQEKDLRQAYWKILLRKHLYLKTPFITYKQAHYLVSELEFNLPNIENLFNQINPFQAWTDFIDCYCSYGTLIFETGRTPYGSLIALAQDIVKSMDLLGHLLEKGQARQTEIISTSYLTSGEVYRSKYVIFRTFKTKRQKVTVRPTKYLLKLIRKNFK